ncbi:YceI family protein [Flavobacterium sp.]|uniref:YceI family protein n=1 Tax=Flavobacterium sp. TaxID=239 RepID=UPI0026328B0C|nr:YceI family protein [Flavobacterium sp.]MDG2432678.1 YceI family protein [Flavobacterium sp.]
MKKILLLLLLSCITVNAQKKWTTHKAIISFEASVPLFEPIEAENRSTICIIDTNRSTINFVVKMKDFQFERKLMQQHFNENYLETKKYPKATFKGTILNFDWVDFTTIQSTFYVEGIITIHGQSKKIKAAIVLKKNGKQLVLTTNFSLNTDDFGIAIPFLVRDKIDRNVKVHLEAILD